MGLVNPGLKVVSLRSLRFKTQSGTGTAMNGLFLLVPTGLLPDGDKRNRKSLSCCQWLLSLATNNNNDVYFSIKYIQPVLGT